jgi:PRTRC genetic system protein A
MDGNAVFGSMVGYYIGIPIKCDKPVSWAICGDGLWEIRRNPLGVFRRHAAEVVVHGLPSGLEEGFDLELPRVPITLLWQAVSFFRRVYEIHSSEAAVRVVWNKKTRRHALDCPSQDVSPARCEFDRRKTVEDSVVVAEIHSHGQMSASFSGTDDKDELADRFYGVVGRLLDFLPQMAFRLAIGGHHLDIDIRDLFDTECDPMLSAKFPPGWLDQVRKREAKSRVAKGSRRRSDDDLDGNEDLLFPNWDFASESQFDDSPDEMRKTWDTLQWQSNPRMR